jgi:hypothetical protein
MSLHHVRLAAAAFACLALMCDADRGPGFVATTATSQCNSDSFCTALEGPNVSGPHLPLHFCVD